ncbi:MAG: hypothetical protein NTU89_03025, partial [Candidatus Dependentiae bacterium]|nr:hypothetical protein [Candidatus Dependentiae bacterium]
MLKKYFYGLLMSGLFFGDGIYANLTTPQSVALQNALAHKNSGISKSVNGPTSNGGNNVAKGTPASSIVSRAAKDSALIDLNQNPLDTSFNSRGIEPGTNVVNVDGDYSWAQSVAIDSQGRAILVGTSMYDSLGHFAVARFLSDGALDTNFGNSGMKSFSMVTGKNSYAMSVVIGLDDAIIVAGTTRNVSNMNQFAIAKLTSAGDFDNTFGTDGIYSFSIIASNKHCEALSVGIDSDGKIIVGGYAYNGSKYQFAVARLTAAGVLDTTFNSTGVNHFSIISGQESNAFAVVIDLSDNSIVLGGSAYDGLKNNFAVARLTPSGELDTNFNGTGVSHFDIISGQESGAVGVAIDSDRKIVLAGYTYDGLLNRFAVAKLNADGTFDTSFNETGKAYTAIDNFIGFDSVASGVAIDVNNNVVIGGYTYEPSGYQTAVARFTPSGVLDRSFNGSGSQPGTAVTTING